MSPTRKTKLALASVGVALLLPAVALLVPVIGFAQGKPAPGPNQAFLYELSENAVLTNSAGHVLAPSSAGLIDTKTGRLDFPARRVATAHLQGVASLGSLLCPNAVLITVPKAKDCTVTATATDDVDLVLDPATGQVVPTSGTVSGTYAVVVQLDNPVDSPELPVQKGRFRGTITFRPPLPLGIVEDGTLTIEGLRQSFPFKATFRQPFANIKNGRHMKAGRGQAAFYLLDDGRLERVQQDERAAGWPTVRFEANF
jgi:hypothetical protein